jgi:hypothetical protein
VVIKFVVSLLVISEIIVWLLVLLYGCMPVIGGFVGDDCRTCAALRRKHPPSKLFKMWQNVGRQEILVFY